MSVVDRLVIDSPTNVTFISATTNAPCIPWLNHTSNGSSCSPQQFKSTLVQTIFFLPIIIITSAIFLISSIRRCIILREKPNTFWAMSICINFWFPLTLVYSVIILIFTYNQNYVTKHPTALSNILPLISWSKWSSYVVLGVSFGPLIAAWLKLSSDNKALKSGNSTRKLTSRMMEISDWHWSLLLTVFVFMILTGGSSVLMGFGGIVYQISARIYFATWTVYLWSCSSLLLYGGIQIKRTVRELSDNNISIYSSSSSSSAPSKDKNNNSSVRNGGGHSEEPVNIIKRVDQNVNRVLGFVVAGLFIPASIGTFINSVALTQIDRSVLASTIVLCLYGICASSYVIFWTITFWTETSYRIMVSKFKDSSMSKSSTTTTIVNVVTSEV